MRGRKTHKPAQCRECIAVDCLDRECPLLRIESIAGNGWIGEDGCIHVKPPISIADDGVNRSGIGRGG